VSLQLGKTGGGPNGAGGPMMMIGGAPPAPGAPGAPGAKPGADANASLRARLAATVPNVHRRTLALNDSLKLALTAEQSAKLRALGDAYQPKADSLVDAIVTTLNAPAAKTDPAAVAAQTKTKTAEAQALLAKAIDDLRGVLTPEQFAKLPGELRGGKR
jgi:hypothetical protein